MKKIILLAAAVITLLSCKNEATTAPETKKIPKVQGNTEDKNLSEAETIAYRHGLEHWDDVTQIDFTFNVDREGQNVAQRSWSWKPKTGDVTMTQGDNTMSYNRSTVDSTSMRADQGFINDKFWLLAPFQLAWDEGTTFKTQDSVTAPLSGTLSKMLTVTYGEAGGYTPGDAYDFYYNDDFVIDEWVFRKGNSPEASMITTFEGYQNFDGLKIATEHSDKEGNFKLYFTDIKVVTD